MINIADTDLPYAPSPDCACDLCVAAELLDAQTFPWELGHEPVAELCREVA